MVNPNPAPKAAAMDAKAKYEQARADFKMAEAKLSIAGGDPNASATGE